MLIGIDASAGWIKTKTGAENYAKNLILALAKIDRKNQYILYSPGPLDADFGNLPTNFKIKILKYIKFWTHTKLAWEMFRNPPDILFSPSHVLPPLSPKKSVITVHDFAWKYFPEAYSKTSLWLQKVAVERAKRKKAQIIVYTQSTLRDLKKFYKISNSKISFVPMGFDRMHYQKIKACLPAGMACSAEIAGPYILSVGRLEKRKNTAGIIKSYLLLRQEKKIKDKLVLVGKPGIGYGEIKNLINGADEIKKDIIETGYVNDKELRVLYSGASLFVFPSLVEGFGFPILEAFAAEIPVVTSNISSMPEVTNGAALLVNPKKPFEIAAAMSQILNKPALRRSLVLKGRSRLKYYSWENCARETLKVFESL